MQVITQGQEPFSVLYERFMQRYFFESFTASNLNQVIQTTTAVSKLKLLHLETMDDHAARSYADWYQRLVDGRDRLLDSGLTPSFLRLYDCYVALMYAGARSRCLQSTQLLLAGPEYTGPEWLLSHAKASYFPSPLVVTK